MNVCKTGAILILFACLIPLRVIHGQRTASFIWGLIGNDGQHLTQEYDAGIRVKLVRLSWRDMFPQENLINPSYVDERRAELTRLYAAGFEVILSFGTHDTPEWIHENYEDSYYVNQYGRRYAPDFIDNGDANLIFNPVLRQLADEYVAEVFELFGDEYAAVRIGGGRYGETGYPPANYNNQVNQYWAFDANARRELPAGNWIPGNASPNDEAGRFYTWYVARLVEYQQWQIDQVRQHYDGPIMILYPGWGIRPGDIDLALGENLRGSSSAEQAGEIQRGVDFARLIATIADPNVMATTTWLDADPGNDDTADKRYWSPVKYLADVLDGHSLPLRLWGENTGQGTLEKLLLSAFQMQKYGLEGMLWYREEEMLSGEYATLTDYADVIYWFGDN